ncbi:MAG TPA: hypothetical protein VGK59_22310 [Ohtaekwangia sp.]
MKGLFLLCATFVASFSLYAQFNTSNPPHIYYTGGNVGIGTSTPAFNLDVNGVIKSSGPMMSSAGFYFNTTPAFIQGTGNVYMPALRLLVGGGPSSSSVGVLSLQVSSSATSYGSLTPSESALYIRANNTTNGNFTVTSFADGNGTDIAQMGSINANHTTHSGKLFFATRPSGGSLTQRLIIDENGNVGIAKTNPGYTLDVNGAINATSILVNGVPVSGSSMQWLSGTSAVYYNGNVGIGNFATASTGSFKLAVDGKIGAREIHVTLANPWPDYVFDTNYKLMPLDEVEQFVQTHKHLPEIPSAQVMEKEGLQLGEMNTLLVKKIEELTLYMIELKKEVDMIKAENEELKNRLKTN